MLDYIKGIQSLKLIFFILKIANIRCFILIAVEIFQHILLETRKTISSHSDFYLYVDCNIESRNLN
jgi:hypothetical protein